MASRDETRSATGSGERLPGFFVLVLVVLPVVLALFAVPVVEAHRHGDQSKVRGWQATPRSGSWVVTSVDPDGPAAALAPGDIVRSIRGDERAAEIGPDWFLRDAPPGGAYRVEVDRLGAARSFGLRLPVEPAPGTILFRILPFLILAAAFYLTGLVVLLAKPHEPMARHGFGVTMLGTSFFLYLASNDGSGMLQGTALDLALVCASVSPLHFVFGYHFYAQFPARSIATPPWRRVGHAIVIVGGLFWVVMTLENSARVAGGELAVAAVSSVAAGYRQYAAYIPGMQMLFVLGTLAATLGIVQHNYRRLPEGDQKRRVRWIATGAIIGLGPMMLTALMLAGTRFVGADEQRGPVAVARTLGNLGGIALPVTIGYAILKQRVLGPRIALRIGLQYLLARNVLRFLLILPAIGLVITVALNRDQTVGELLGGAAGANLALLAAVAMSLRWRRPLMRAMDRRFFRGAYDREQILLDLIHDVKTMDSVAEISTLVRGQIENALHPRGVFVFHHRERERDLSLVQSSAPPGVTVQVPDRSELSTVLQRAKRPVEWSSIRDRCGPGFVDQMTSLAVQLLVPVPGTDGSLLGLILLADKQSEEPYTRRDLELLESIATQVGVVYENLALRERVKIEEQAQVHILARLDEQDVEVMRECPLCGRCYDGSDETCAADLEPLEIRIPTGRLINGKYLLERRIGEGGMGAVYEATDRRLARRVAVKILTGRLFGDGAALRRFTREARAAALLDHPSLVRVHDFGELHGEGAFMVQEYVAGGPLSEAYPEFAADLTVAADVLDQILEAMDVAHASQVIHRDLTPNNILIERRRDAEGHAVKILDFGLAKVAQLEFADPKSRTREGATMGTLGYMSLEQSVGGEVDERTDVYSLGVIALEMVTGPIAKSGHASCFHMEEMLSTRLAFEGATPAHDGLRQALAPAVALERDQRYPTVAEMRAEVIPAIRSLAISVA